MHRLSFAFLSLTLALVAGPSGLLPGALAPGAFAQTSATETGPEAPARLQPAIPDDADYPQPALPQGPLTVVTGEARHDFTVELADDPEEIRIGMMGRERLAEDAGMLFDLGSPRPAQFWMKNTPLPLDLLFLAADGEIVAIAENAVPFSERRISPGLPVKAVLEVNAGTAARLSIAPGDRVEHALFDSDSNGG